MRVVVSGGAGFIGSHLCRRLLDRGDQVVVLDNLITGSLENLADLTSRDGFEFVEHDVSNYTEVDGSVDAVMHLASPASPKDFSQIPIKILKANGMGSHRLLGLALAKQARFVLASTSEVYGDPLTHPQSESYWGNVNPIGTRSMYDESKRFAEALAFSYHRHHGLGIGIVRTFNTYGPGMKLDDGRVIGNFIVQALQNEPLTLHGDGTQTRSFCYLDDQVDGYVAMLDSDSTGPVNIGNPVEMTILELAELILDMTCSSSSLVKLPLPADDPVRRCPDVSLAKIELGWEPKVSLHDGLTKTIEYFRSRLEK